MTRLLEDGGERLLETGGTRLLEYIPADALITEAGAPLLTEAGDYLLAPTGAVGAALAGAATLRLTASATLTLPAAPAALQGTATLRLTGSANLSVPARLEGTATLRLTAGGNLAVRAALAGFASLRLTATGSLGTPPAALAGTATLRLTAVSATLTTNGTPIAASASLTLSAVGDLTPVRAALAARARLVLTAAGALVSYPELRLLRSADIHRPVGYVEETSPGTARLNVLRFTLESSLDTPADGWTAEVAGAALMTAPNDEALYRLSVGLFNAEDAEVVAAHIASGRILDRRLVGRWPERRTYIRGLDAIERTFALRRRVRYVPTDGQVVVLRTREQELQTALTARRAEIQTLRLEDPAPDTEARITSLQRIVTDLETGVVAAREAEVPEKVGTWTASAIAADLLVGTGLTVSWECRDYTMAAPFDAVGTVWELLQRLVEPWNQVPPFGVDVWSAGTVVRVRARTLRPPADLTMTVAESRLVELDLGDRRRLPLIGTVNLEGRIDAAGSEEFHGETTPGIGEPVLPVLSSEMTVEFHQDMVNGSVSGTRTYRMPDKLLIRYEEWVESFVPGAGYWVTKHETQTYEYEDSHYGPHGPLNQPMPLSSTKEIETLQKAADDPNVLILTLTSREEVVWKYDHRRFLESKETRRYTRSTEGAVVGYPLTENIIETWTPQADGWFALVTTTNRFDPKTGQFSSVATQKPQDLAGFPPGGPRLNWSFSTFITAPEGPDPGDPVPVRVYAVVSTDPTAIPFAYNNPNLTRGDLDYILQQCRDASGLVEYPLRGNGPALADIVKGSALHLTEYVDADGSPIPLDPALVRGISFEYEDTPASSRSTCVIDAVFYRRE
jgi:hypothetical protein